MIRVIPFEVGHLDLMRVRDEFLSENYKEMARQNHAAKNTLTLTIVCGMTPIAVVGLMKIYSGVAGIWAITSKDVEAHKKSFHKTVIALLKTVVKDFNLHRVHCTIKNDWEMAINWIERLGFNFEGTMKQFGLDKSDYCLFARTEWE